MQLAEAALGPRVEFRNSPASPPAMLPLEEKEKRGSEEIEAEGNFKKIVVHVITSRLGKVQSRLKGTS